MRFAIKNLNTGLFVVWETEDDVQGQILLDSISIPFGKMPELIIVETAVMFLINLTNQEIDEALTSLMHMAHNEEIGFFIDWAMSQKKYSWIAQVDVA